MLGFEKRSWACQLATQTKSFEALPANAPRERV